MLPTKKGVHVGPRTGADDEQNGVEPHTEGSDNLLKRLPQGEAGDGRPQARKPALSSSRQLEKKAELAKKDAMNREGGNLERHSEEVADGRRSDGEIKAGIKNKEWGLN